MAESKVHIPRLEVSPKAQSFVLVGGKWDEQKAFIQCALQETWEKAKLKPRYMSVDDVGLKAAESELTARANEEEDAELMPVIVRDAEHVRDFAKTVLWNTRKLNLMSFISCSGDSPLHPLWKASTWLVLFPALDDEVLHQMYKDLDSPLGDNEAGFNQFRGWYLMITYKSDLFHRCMVINRSKDTTFSKRVFVATARPTRHAIHNSLWAGLHSTVDFSCIGKHHEIL